MGADQNRIILPRQSLQGKLENIMLAIDSSNPLRITVLNQVPKALELLRQDPQVSRLSVDENKIADKNNPGNPR